MKILIYVFLLTFILSVPSFADETIPNRPVWSQFCPLGMENAIYKDIKWFWPDGTRATQEIYNYWANRRAEFEADEAECDKITLEFRGACYQSLISKQSISTELYDKDVQNKKISNQVWKDTNRVTNSIMINILPR